MKALLRHALYVAILSPLIKANIDTGGSYTIGENAPWGLPESIFRPLSQANTSDPREPLAFTGQFWTIGISLQADIPLNESTDRNLNATEKQQFTQLVSMSLDNIDKSQAANLTEKTRMCGHVIFSLRSNETANNQDDAGKGGNCDFLSQQCQKTWRQRPATSQMTVTRLLCQTLAESGLILLLATRSHRRTRLRLVG
jgi:hypothetical protein